MSRGDHAAAVARYVGPLLSGFRAPEAPEFESWLELERESLHGRWRRAALELAEERLGEGRPAKAADLLGPVLRADQFDEEVVRSRLRALAAAHGPGEALASFERFRARLAEEMDGEPEERTLELLEAVRNGEVSMAPATAAARPSRGRQQPRPPAHPTPFVGRATELELLAARLRTATCRVFTLLGPGGMGKTRPALELVSRLQDAFPGGVAYAPRAGVGRSTMSLPPSPVRWGCSSVPRATRSDR
ncbi:MAG TPA: bacterial transcriptional activator domain-containing protein [Trueperaceae bacterium]